MRNINLDQVEAWYWTHTLRSFGAAGKKLGITQPAVSLRVKALEDAWGGYVLINRKTMRLTSAGRRALPAFEHILKAHRELRAALPDEEEGPIVLRLGVMETIVHSRLSGLLRNLRARHPNLQLQLTVLASLLLEDQLKMDDIDVAIGVRDMTGHDLGTEALTPMPMVLVGNSDAYPNASYQLEEVVRDGIIAFQLNTPIHQQCMSLVNGLTSNFTLHTVNSVAAMSTLMLAGYGVATLPREVADGLVARTPGLRIIPSQPKLPDLPLFVNWRIPPARSQRAEIIGLIRAFMRRKRAPTNSSPP